LTRIGRIRRRIRTTREQKAKGEDSIAKAEEQCHHQRAYEGGSGGEED